jgi:hypothetical protein
MITTLSTEITNRQLDIVNELDSIERQIRHAEYEMEMFEESRNRNLMLVMRLELDQRRLTMEHARLQRSLELNSLTIY